MADARKLEMERKIEEISELAGISRGQLAWGGIGGSGKHASEMMAELVTIAKQPELQEMLGRKAWGGIGGSGKHASELEPEIVKK